MNRNSYILSIFACLFSISAKPQIEYDVIRPSVNAEQFGIAAKADAALSSGQLSLSIPLMELKGKGYDLPISLTFYSGDVTFCSEASPIGLGWALMAGGVITKTIKGADDTTNRTDNSHFTDGDYIVNRYKDWRNHSIFVCDIQADPMPDEYTYSLPGHSGTIDVSVNGGTITSRELYPDESYRIETTGSGYCITADDGTRFYFEDAERRTVSTDYESTSWFLTRIVTAKGGVFTFNYADEEYVDLSTEEDERYFEKFRTKRITSIVSDFGSVVFSSALRSDRGGIGNRSIAQGLESRRINKIEMRDENGGFVKGYELDNSGSFTYSFAPEDNHWLNYRHKLSSVTQYDAAGNRLPPYEFSYSYKFSNSRLAALTPNTNSDGDYLPRNSWTSYVGPQAYVDLKPNGDPSCSMIYPNTPYTYLTGITIKFENFAATAGDYFCLSSVDYPTGATDEFTYENHNYSKVNRTVPSALRANRIHGKRIASKVRYGTELTQQTEYVYKLHDSDYNVTGQSSGVMTNPSIHCATYYTPQRDYNSWKYSASRITSGKAFNSFMGPPVCYTEVEEVEKDMSGNVLGRTIHYFDHKTVLPPVNYIFVKAHADASTSLIETGNRIYGTKSGYMEDMSYCNNENMTYLAYPVCEFTNGNYIGDQPLKEVFIGKDGKVRSVREYSYYFGENRIRYGYKTSSKEYFQQNASGPTLDYTADLISRSEYIPQRFRLNDIRTTLYYYNGETRDSVRENYTVHHNRGRIDFTSYSRSNDKESTYYYFPGDIMNIVGNNTSPALEAVNGLIDRNIIADPIKTVVKRNGSVIGGECKDYRMLSSRPLLKSLYKIKKTGNNAVVDAPAINGNDINYGAELYKEGEVMTYDKYLNPEHIRIKDSQDRIYVWGYGGRFPVAVIDNMDYAAFNADTTLKNLLSGLSSFRKIETEAECMNLRNANNAIRNRVPETAQITTYTYDPYYGITSEMDSSNLGTIYTYDTFGRLTAKYDAYYKQTEEYNYNLHLQ